jgi:hypothetical protein
MSAKNPIRVFVTHTFADHSDYHRVFEYLESSPNFYYINCSAPQNAPPTGGKEAIKDELRKQIKTAEVVVVLASMYSDNREWITYQMDVAQAFELPLVAVKGFGVVSDLPPDIARRADESVDWDERAMIDAIRRQARHEDTSRWEVIEFDI